MINEAFSKVMDLAQAAGAERIDKNPHGWTYQVDGQWRLFLNAQQHEVDDTPPYHVKVLFNGWPAGMFSFHGGIIAGGEAANEDTFIEALDAAIERERGDK